MKSSHSAHQPYRTRAWCPGTRCLGLKTLNSKKKKKNPSTQHKPGTESISRAFHTSLQKCFCIELKWQAQIEPDNFARIWPEPNKILSKQDLSQTTSSFKFKSLGEVCSKWTWTGPSNHPKCPKPCNTLKQHQVWICFWNIVLFPGCVLQVDVDFLTIFPKQWMSSINAHEHT